MDSAFDVLDIDPDASEEEVERAYQRRVKQAHPDHGGSLSEFQLVRGAYQAILAGYPADLDTAATTDDDAPPQAAGPADDPGDRPRNAKVEYLDYALLQDRGWSLEDEDLFEKAAAADVPATDYGKLLVEPDESLLEAAEHRGFTWPYACRGGACANCAVAVCDGEMTTPAHHILSSDLLERGFRLSCLGAPTTDELQVVFNVKHLPDLDELRLPPHPFEGAHRND